MIKNQKPFSEQTPQEQSRVVLRIVMTLGEMAGMPVTQSWVEGARCGINLTAALFMRGPRGAELMYNLMDQIVLPIEGRPSVENLDTILDVMEEHLRGEAHE